MIKTRYQDDLLETYWTNKSANIATISKDEVSLLIPLENVAAFGKVLEDQKKESNIQAESAPDISRGNQSFIFQE